MEFIYLIIVNYRDTNYRLRGTFQNICFKTEKEAKTFCKHHDDEYQFYSYEKIQIGKFKNKRS